MVPVPDNQVIFIKMSIHVPRGVGATKLGISWRRYSVFPCTLIRLFLQRNLCSACLITVQVFTPVLFATNYMER